MTNEFDTIVEALIFASPEGVSTKEITRCIKAAAKTAKEAEPENPPEHIMQFAGITDDEVNAAISRLNLTYIEQGRAFLLQERPAGWRIMSRLEYSPWVREMFPDKRPARLSAGALETLAIIAYRQPLTRSSIEAVRGVAIDGPLQTLLDRNMVRIAGRADLPGRPLLYETTDLFLEHFGIRNVEELPNSAELRSVKLPEPEPPKEETPPADQTELPLESAESAPPSDDAPAEEKPKKKSRGKKKSAEPAAGESPPAAADEPGVPAEEAPFIAEESNPAE
jgi:segregation and condensation protein B